MAVITRIRHPDPSPQKTRPANELHIPRYEHVRTGSAREKRFHAPTMSCPAAGYEQYAQPSPISARKKTRSTLCEPKAKENQRGELEDDPGSDRLAREPVSAHVVFKEFVDLQTRANRNRRRRWDRCENREPARSPTYTDTAPTRRQKSRLDDERKLNSVKCWTLPRRTKSAGGPSTPGFSVKNHLTTDSDLFLEARCRFWRASSKAPPGRASPGCRHLA